MRYLLILLLFCFETTYSQYTSNSLFVAEYNFSEKEFDAGTLKRVPTYDIDLDAENLSIRISGSVRTKAYYKLNDVINLKENKDITAKGVDKDGTEVYINLTMKNGLLANIIVIYPEDKILAYLISDASE